MNGPSLLSLPAPAGIPFPHTYHPDGRLKTTEDAAGLHTYLYAGPNGALSGETITGSGLLAGAVMSYGYDDQKRRDQHTWTWGSGQSRTTGLTFDTAGRLHTVTAFGQTATYGYEAGTGRLDTLAYTGTGSLTGSWDYDERGRLDVVSWQRGVDTVSRHDYGYATDMNRRTTALRETGDEWRYGYNLRGEVESAAKAQGTAANAPLWKGLVSGYGYDGIGNRTTETVDTPTGTETLDWTPNAVNQITQREVARGKWVLGRVHPEAALTAKKDGVDLPNGSVVREGENFAVPMEAGLAAGQPAWKALSLSASREGVGKNGATVQQTQTGSLWFAASPESLTYDEDGNLQTDGRWLYLWDAENRLKAMETQASAIAAGVPAMRLEFAYDAMGRRVQKVVKSFSSSAWVVTSDLRYLYDGWNLVAEFEKHSPSLPLSSSPRLVRAYAWGRDLSGTMQGAGGVGGLVLVQAQKQLPTTANNSNQPPTVSAPCYDGNGNITAYLDLANNRITARLDYDAFGKPVWSELSSTVGAGERIPFGFSTKYEDRETGLLYYGYRYYAPELGRWLSRDPIEEDGGINLYGMVGNDAANIIDYLGLEWCMQKDFSGGNRSPYSGKFKRDSETDTAKTLAKLLTGSELSADKIKIENNVADVADYLEDVERRLREKVEQLAKQFSGRNIPFSPGSTQNYSGNELNTFFNPNSPVGPAHGVDCYGAITTIMARATQDILLTGGLFDKLKLRSSDFGRERQGMIKVRGSVQSPGHMKLGDWGALQGWQVRNNDPDQKRRIQNPWIPDPANGGSAGENFLKLSGEKFFGHNPTFGISILSLEQLNGLNGYPDPTSGTNANRRYPGFMRENVWFIDIVKLVRKAWKLHLEQ